MATHKNNASKLSECEPHHGCKLVSWNIVWNEPYLKALYNVCMFLLMDNLMENSNMAMLIMEPSKQIITLHNNYCLSSYSISCRHFTWLQNWKQTKCCMWHHCPKITKTILSTCYINTHHLQWQSWDLILAAVSVLNMYIVHDDQLYLNDLDTYTLCTVHVQDSVVVRHERTNYMHGIAHMLYSM